MGIMDWFDNPVTSITDSVVKNVFMDKVKPKVGSILKVDIGLWFANHTGIYIGNNQIVELYNDDGIATIRIVSPMKFLRGEADSLARYGSYIYCACYDDEVLEPMKLLKELKRLLEMLIYTHYSEEKIVTDLHHIALQVEKVLKLQI